MIKGYSVPWDFSWTENYKLFSGNYFKKTFRMGATLEGEVTGEEDLLEGADLFLGGTRKTPEGLAEHRAED